MKRFSLLIGLVLQLILSSAYADSELSAQFSRTFTTNYVAGQCGDNVIGLVERSEDRRLNLNTARILEITNVGFSVFGLINAEFARGKGRQGAPGETNWYHHVVLEKDGLIYDYDFGNTPAVTPIAKYFEKMFLVEKKKAEGGDFYVGREEKLKTYQIVIRSGLEVTAARRTRTSQPKGETMRLEEFLRSFAID